KQRFKTVGRVVGAGYVVRERTTTGGRVGAAGGVLRERIRTEGRVVVAAREASELIITLSRIEVGQPAVCCLSSMRRSKDSQRERERDEKKTAYNPHCLGTRQLLLTR